MMSNKQAFSLTSLITILTLAFMAPTAMAVDDGPTVKISTADHHFDDGKQIIEGANTPKGKSEIADSVKVTFEFGDAVNYDESVTAAGSATAGVFEPLVDVVWVFTDKDGIEKGTPPAIAATNWGQVNGKKYEAVIAGLDTEDRVVVYVERDTATAISGKTFGKSNQRSESYTFQIIAADPAAPKTVILKRLPPQSGFMSDKVTGPFDVKIVLSEKPKEFTKANLGIKNGSLGTVIPGGSIERYKYLSANEDGARDNYDKPDATPANDLPDAGSGDYIATYDTTGAGAVLMPVASGADRKFYRYSVTVTPDFKKDKVIVWVKDFEDRHIRAKGYNVFGYAKVPDDLNAPRQKIEVPVDQTGRKPVATPGMSVGIPGDTIIPAGGYLVVVRDDGDGANEAEKSSDSQVIHPGDRKVENLAGSGRSVVKQLYNVVPVDLKYDLEGFLLRGGTIDLIAPDAGVVISEIMWATDGGENNRQWIEIHNTGSTQLKTTKDYKLMLYTANEALPDTAVAANKIVDRVSTLYKGTNHWSIVGKGKPGRTEGVIERTIGEGADVDIDIEVVSTAALVSMERVRDAAGMYADGTMGGSWGASVPPSSNFTDAAGGLFVGSPGADPINPVADPVPEPEPTPAPMIPVADADDIVITEIMVDTGNGRLPQWIELNNVSGKEVSLAGWTVEIENDAADTVAVSSRVEIDLMGTLGVSAHAGNTGQGNSLLLVSREGRSSANLEGNKNIVDVSSVVGERGHYKLISDIAFMVTLVPPQKSGVFTPGNMAGNLDANPAWDIPMDETGRSSLIRREMDAGMMTMGTDANGWVLASSTSLVDGPATWYGSDEDAGTPGYDAGGPLPVELSHFRPARDKATGQVVITWATQSELNNAGFFIKRSNQKDGEFKVINATMIAGAGTTSEKQFYTYTDTTAQPNVVYYYQIEDVSLDGNRQTLTRGIRLKGHIGAAGKATTLWGELKMSHE